MNEVMNGYAIMRVQNRPHRKTSLEANAKVQILIFTNKVVAVKRGE